MSVTAELADGRRLEFPDGTNPEVVQATVKKVISGGFDKKEEAQPEKPGILDRLKGAGEAALSMGTAATSGMVGRLGGTIGGIAGSVASGQYGTQEGVREASRTAEESARRFTYEPKTEAGRDAMEAISSFFDKTKLAGLGPSEAVALTGVSQSAQAVRPVAGHAARVLRGQAQDLRDKAVTAARDIRERVSPAPEMAGVGAAETAESTMRRQRAADLPVPIKLTKGQAERTFEQQQFEKEMAKHPKVGEPLRERFSQQNSQILQNFDAWIDQTGAEGGSLRAVGQSVTDAVVNKANRAKGEIRSAYDKARSSGDMQERIDIGPLQRYIDEHQAEAINAPVLTSVEAKLSRISKEGAASINDLEEVRKMVGRLSGKDATNALFGKEVKGVIDDMTEGRGGDMYKNARSLRQRYARDFEDHAVVDRLLSFKPGTRDRSVAYEDVFGHTILKGSLDDVRTVRRTLQTAGPEGEKAWRELQGATVQHIKDEITKNVQIDQAGNRVISPARLDRLVSELDKDGKLDFVFGKKGAQQIRDVNGIAQDVFTSPPGSVNTSNTASILIGLLDTAVSGVSGAPLPIGTAAHFAVKRVKERGLRKRVGEALE